MSPDYFSDLRRKAEQKAAEQARQERLARERRIQAEAIQKRQDLARQDLERRREIARGVMEQTDFPQLLDELRDLFHNAGEGHMQIITGTPPITSVDTEGYGYTTTKTTTKTWENPYRPQEDGYVLSALWSTDWSREADRALFVEATPDGTVSVSGSGRTMLRESGWRGNSFLQQQALERAYNNYFHIKRKIKVDNKTYRTGESGGGAGS